MSPPRPPPAPESAAELGRRGEALAASFFEAAGWSVLQRNYRAGRKEVDLVVCRGPVVAFVEVKTRRGLGFGHPLEAITRRKRREIAHVARSWRRDHPGMGSVLRFDAVAVCVDGAGRVSIDHVPDAWRLE